MKKLNIISIALFIIILLIPIFTFNFKTNQISAIDNRKLAELPHFSMKSGLNSYVKNAKDYFTDRIGLRLTMISSSVVIQDKLFGVLAHPSYTNGKNGYIFFKLNPQLKDFDYISDFSNFVSKIQTYCNDRGTDFLFSLEPNKINVYQQYLPSGYNYKNDRIPFMLNALTKNNVNHMYTAPILTEAAKSTQVYNVKFDAGHWNDDGAFVAMSEMLKNLQKGNHSFSLPSKSDYTVSKVLHTSLPVSYFPIHEEAPSYALKTPQAVKTDTYKGEVKMNSSGWYYSYYKNPSKPKAPKILVFMGSYFEYREKFIAESFSDTVFVHSYLNVQNLDYYFNLYHPDIVLFQSADYATTNQYYPLSLIDNVTYNPAYKLVKDLPIVHSATLNSASKQKLVDTAKNSKTLLTNFSLDLSGAQISYAYAQIDGKIYDFKVAAQDGKQTINIVLDKNTILSAKQIQIMLISANKNQQTIIKL